MRFDLPNHWSTARGGGKHINDARLHLPVCVIGDSYSHFHNSERGLLKSDRRILFLTFPFRVPRRPLCRFLRLR